MATWWCCCLNYSRIYELVDTQRRAGFQENKRISNDQLSNMNNFPGLTVSVNVRVCRQRLTRMLCETSSDRVSQATRQNSRVQSMYDAAFFAPVPPNFMHVNMRPRICKTFIGILNGPSSP